MTRIALTLAALLATLLAFAAPATAKLHRLSVEGGGSCARAEVGARSTHIACNVDRITVLYIKCHRPRYNRLHPIRCGEKREHAVSAKHLRKVNPVAGSCARVVPGALGACDFPNLRARHPFKMTRCYHPDFRDRHPVRCERWLERHGKDAR